MRTQSFKIHFSLIWVLLLLVAVSCDPSDGGKTKTPGGPAKPKSCNVNLYIENSASMYGYVGAGTRLADNLSNLLADLNLSGMVSGDLNISYHYINSQIYKVDKSFQNCLKDMKNDIKSEKFGKDKGTTHIDKLIQDVLAKTNTSSLSILVSDMILSPGKNNDASQFMTSTSNNISTFFSHQADKAAVLFHCSAPYKGLYYNHVDATKSINTSRPYYVLVLGELSLVKKFLAAQNNSNRKFIYSNRVTFFKYDLVTACRINSVSAGAGVISNDKKSIEDAALRDEKFQFTVSVDLSKILEDKSYITNVCNWKTNTSKYTITSVKEQKGVGQTHIITVMTDKRINKQLLKLSLNRTKMPRWVENTTITAEDANKIFDSAYLTKTFGLKEIVTGIYDGYYYNMSDNYAELKIQIN